MPAMNHHDDTRIMTVGDWMITLLVLAMPLVNIIMYPVRAFSSTGNINRRNFCRASLLWFVIITGISIVIGTIIVVFGPAFGTPHHM